MKTKKKNMKLPLLLLSSLSVTPMIFSISQTTGDRSIVYVNNIAYDDFVRIESPEAWTNWNNIEYPGRVHNLDRTKYEFLLNNTPTRKGEPATTPREQGEKGSDYFGLEWALGQDKDHRRTTSDTVGSTRDWYRFFSVDDKNKQLNQNKLTPLQAAVYDFQKWGQFSTYNWMGSQLSENATTLKKGKFWTGDGFSTKTGTKKFRIGFNISNLRTFDSKFFGAIWMSNDMILTGNVNITVFSRKSDNWDYKTLKQENVKTYTFQINESPDFDDVNDNQINPFLHYFDTRISDNESNRVRITENGEEKYWASLDKIQYVPFYDIPENIKRSDKYNKDWISPEGEKIGDSPKKIVELYQNKGVTLSKILLDSKPVSIYGRYDFAPDSDGEVKYGLSLDSDKWTTEKRSALNINGGSILNFEVNYSSAKHENNESEYTTSAIVEFEIKPTEQMSKPGTTFFGAGSGKFGTYDSKSFLSEGFTKFGSREQTSIKQMIVRERMSVEEKFRQPNETIPRFKVEIKNKNENNKLIAANEKRDFHNVMEHKKQTNGNLDTYNTHFYIQDGARYTADDLIVSPELLNSDVWYAGTSTNPKDHVFNEETGSLNEGLIFKEIVYYLTDKEKIRRYVENKKWLTRKQKDEIIRQSINVLGNNQINFADDKYWNYETKREEGTTKALESFIQWADRLDHAQEEAERYASYLTDDAFYETTLSYKIDGISIPKLIDFTFAAKLKRTIETYIQTLKISTDFRSEEYQPNSGLDRNSKDENTLSQYQFKDFKELEQSYERIQRVIKRLEEDSKARIQKELFGRLTFINNDEDFIQKGIKKLSINETTNYILVQKKGFGGNVKTWKDWVKEEFQPGFQKNDPAQNVSDDYSKLSSSQKVLYDQYYGLVTSSLKQARDRLVALKDIYKELKKQKDAFISNNPDSTYRDVYGMSTNQTISDEWYNNFLEKIQDVNIPEENSIYKDKETLNAFLNKSIEDLKTNWIIPMQNSDGNKNQAIKNLETFNYLLDEDLTNFKNKVQAINDQNFSFNDTNFTLTNNINKVDEKYQAIIDEAFAKSKENAKDKAKKALTYVKEDEINKLDEALLFKGISKASSNKLNEDVNVRFGNDSNISNIYSNLIRINNFRKGFIDLVNSTSINEQTNLLTQSQKDALIAKIKSSLTYDQAKSESATNTIYNDLEAQILGLNKLMNDLQTKIDTHDLKGDKYLLATNKADYDTKRKEVVDFLASGSNIDTSSVNQLNEDFQTKYDALNGDTVGLEQKRLNELVVNFTKNTQQAMAKLGHEIWTQPYFVFLYI
ncbi:hypothetical protein [Mycoplasmopsis gallopavonis]|uniref:ECM-binding protein homolog n=1 Tax=Mycoplasmopsis gallopavonis TaxID=76629 RepID=A0A449AYI2_9BACT|nr:hypothetical protein [Mycoplasmopsis gallopavonis]RIV16750.1 hypothetical protein D1113_01205 [Mycoplasmopsis gallopavonis]VEU72560.1 Uncharacterised protein [Mycoplasmopsis gallopavonis]